MNKYKLLKPYEWMEGGGTHPTNKIRKLPPDRDISAVYIKKNSISLFEVL